MSRLVVAATSTDVQGVIPVPPSKYHLHRAFILGALAQGETFIEGHSDAKHIRDTRNSLRDLGVSIQHTETGYRVAGTGGVFHSRNGKVRVGSSGSTLQFLLGLGSLAQSPVTYDGINALRRRPIGPLLHALSTLGIRTQSHQDRLPVTVMPGRPTGGHVAIQGTLSQWISGLLMVAPFAEKPTTVEIRDPFNERTYIHLTVSFLRQFGIELSCDDSERIWTVPANQQYHPASVRLDADLSSAAFALIYAALHPGRVTLTHIHGAGDHPEGRILDILREMEVPLHIDEATGTVTVHNDGRRPRGAVIDMQDIPDLIPALAAFASQAKGRTILRNIGPGRLKESNRVKAMLQLRKMGARMEESGDNLIIDGVGSLHGAQISSYNDHRVLMAFTIAASTASGFTELTFPRAYETSYPEFLTQMRTIGLNAEVGDVPTMTSVQERELVVSAGH